MKLKLFGRDIFEMTKSKGKAVYNIAHEEFEKQATLIDFYKHAGYATNEGSILSDWALIATPSGGYVAAQKAVQKKAKGRPKAEKPVVEKPKMTPKGAFEAKLLHDQTFTINADPKYVDEQLETMKDKLGMIKTTEFDMNRGTTEIASIIGRLENRKQYAKYRGFFDEFAYTTTAKVVGLTKAHDNLKLGEVEQFIADMPKEAVDVMKAYTAKTKELCGKKPVFYIVADKKDFQKSDRRRDPILLAQSPFGHFWQILGAWDDEMVMVEEL